MRLSRILEESKRVAHGHADSFITFYNAAGEQLAHIKRAKCARFSMQAASDHRLMDQFKQQNAAAARAAIDGMAAEFHYDKHGRVIEASK